MAHDERFEISHLMTKDEINKLPMIRFEGKSYLIVKEEDCIRACQKLSVEKVLGFDTESRPSFKKGEHYGVSLLQLATSTEAYLFRLNKIPLNNHLTNLLSRDDILKVGVAIKDDIVGLQKLADFKAQAFIDIADLAKSLGAKNFGLRGLAAIIFKKRISKQAKISNWESGKLSAAQMTYAATDAWISLEIYKKLISLKDSL